MKMQNFIGQKLILSQNVIHLYYSMDFNCCINTLAKLKVINTQLEVIFNIEEQCKVEVIKSDR